jgi:hypothetical protein
MRPLDDRIRRAETEPRARPSKDEPLLPS